jgi:hypothetical protein
MAGLRHCQILNAFDIEGDSYFQHSHALFRKKSRVPPCRKAGGSPCVNAMIRGTISLWLIIVKLNLITETMETEQC